MNREMLRAEELGVELEIAGYLAIWEASLVNKHPKAVDRIRESIKQRGSGECGCECEV